MVGGPRELALDCLTLFVHEVRLFLLQQHPPPDPLVPTGKRPSSVLKHQRGVDFELDRGVLKLLSLLLRAKPGVLGDGVRALFLTCFAE